MPNSRLLSPKLFLHLIVCKSAVQISHLMPVYLGRVDNGSLKRNQPCSCRSAHQLPSATEEAPPDIVPIRSWTRTLRPPGIRHRHLPYHTIPYHHPTPQNKNKNYMTTTELN